MRQELGGNFRGTLFPLSDYYLSYPLTKLGVSVGLV